MARSDLMSLLPDFTETRPEQPRRHAAPGFEPLVHAALDREEFTSLDMPMGFFAPMESDEPGIGDDPFADLAMPELGQDPALGELPDLVDSGGDEEGDLGDELANLLGDIGDSLRSPEFARPAPLPVTGLEDVDLSAADAIAAQEALEAAHREEIDRLNGEHREAMRTVMDEALPKAKQEILDALSAELGPLMAGRLREGFVRTSLDALAGQLAELLDDGSALSFDLHGPEYLISAFVEDWSGDANQIRAVPSDGVDLIARIDRTVIATRLSEFDRLMQEAVA